MEPKPFGTLLREYRRRVNLDQEALADLAHTSRQVIQGYESGRRDPRTKRDVNMLNALATALKLSEEQREALEKAPRGPKPKTLPSMVDDQANRSDGEAAPEPASDVAASALEEEAVSPRLAAASDHHEEDVPDAAQAAPSDGTATRQRSAPSVRLGQGALALVLLLTIALGIGYGVSRIQASHAATVTHIVQGYVQTQRCGPHPKQIGSDFYMPSHGNPQCNAIQWIPVVSQEVTTCSFYAMRPTDTVNGHQYRGTANVIYDMNRRGHFQANISVPAMPYHTWYYLVSTDPLSITFGVGDNAGQGQGLIGLGPIKAVCS